MSSLWGNSIFGRAVIWPPRAARAAASASTVSVLPRRRRSWAVWAHDLYHLDTGCAQMTSQAGSAVKVCAAASTAM